MFLDLVLIALDP